MVAEWARVSGVRGRIGGWQLYLQYNPNSKHHTSSQASASFVSSLENRPPPVNTFTQSTPIHNQKSHMTTSTSTSKNRYTMRYTILGNRYCQNIGRQHKSNGIMLEADLHLGLLSQLCWDPDCRGYRSPPVIIPTQYMPTAEAVCGYHDAQEVARMREVDPQLLLL